MQSCKRGIFYLYVLVLSLGLCSSSSFARSYEARGWCCSVVTCENSVHFINVYIKYFRFTCPSFYLAWPPGVRWANINVSFPGPPPGPTMDSGVFFFLPRLEGAGITTMWEAPSSFLSRWENIQHQLIRRQLLVITVLIQNQFQQNMTSDNIRHVQMFTFIQQRYLMLKSKKHTWQY